MPDESNEFDRWVLTKDLERGISIVAQMKKDQIVLDRFDDILSSAIAIDASLGLLQISADTNKCSKKTMKHALRSWAIKKKYTFKEVPIDEGMNARFSQHGKDLYIRNKGDGEFHLYSCNYVKCEDDESQKDQRLINGIFLKEFNRKWEEAIVQLHERLQVEFGANIAEAKIKVEKETMREAKYSGVFDHKQFFQESKEEKCSQRYISHKEMKTGRNEARVWDHERLTAQAYGISIRRFIHRLSFGKRTLVQLEKDVEREEIRRRDIQKEEKEAGAKLVHEQWVDKKVQEAREDEIAQSFRKKNQTRFQSMLRTGPSMQPKVQKSGKRRESNVDKSPPKPSIPKIWAEEMGEGDDRRLVTIYWDTDYSYVDYFILSMYDREGKVRLTQWRNEEEKKMTLSLHPGSYWFGICSSSRYGESPEARMYVSSKPLVPGELILCKATEYSLELHWEQRDIKPRNCDNKVVTPKVTGTCTNNIYNVIECCIDDDNDEWEEIWRGSTNSATIGGLLDDSSYKLRVQSRSRDLSSSYGESRVFHTLIRTPKTPRVKNIGTNFIDLCWSKPELIEANGRKGNLSLRKTFGNWGNFLHLNDWEKVRNMLGIPGVCEEEKEIIKEGIESGNVLKEHDFAHLWSHHLLFTLYQADEYASTGKQIKRTKNSTYRVKDLLPNSSYSFRLRCKTLRGFSCMSPPLTVHTLPECPTGLYLIHIDSNEILVKVNSSSFGEKLVLETREDGKDQWHLVYVGRKNIVKIPHLRPWREYEIKAKFINAADVEGDFICRKVRTKDKPFAWNSSTIAELFSIDCQDIIEGDVILFSEIYQSPPNGDSNQRSVAARIISLKDPNAVSMEVAWVSSKDLATGSVIERDPETLKEFEVLRMPWTDEVERILN